MPHDGEGADDDDEIRHPIRLTQGPSPVVTATPARETASAAFASALEWLGPVVDDQPGGRVARVSHPDAPTLHAIVRLDASVKSGRHAISLRGALPPAGGGDVRLRSERGLVGYVRSLADRRIGHDAIDHRFLVDGDTRLAREWIPVSSRLAALHEAGDTRASLGGDAVELAVEPIGRDDVRAVTEAAVLAWMAIARRRLGLVDQAAEREEPL